MYTTSCKLERYARSYQCAEKQYTDVFGRPLYSLLPRMQQMPQAPQHSQAVASVIHAGTWTAIASSADLDLSLEVKVSGPNTVVMAIRAVVVATGSEAIAAGSTYILETFDFPKAFDRNLKVSARNQSLGFRFSSSEQAQSINFFQLVFSTALECRLCYDTMYRFGILTPAWPEMVQIDCGMNWGHLNNLERQSQSPLQLWPKQSLPVPIKSPLQPSVQQHLASLPAAVVPIVTDPVLTLPKLVNMPSDPDETRLSSTADHDSTIRNDRDEEPGILSITLDSPLQGDASQIKRIVKSQEKARRMILEGLPEEIKELRESVQKSQWNEQSKDTDNIDDFTFLRAASYNYFS